MRGVPLRSRNTRDTLDRPSGMSLLSLSSPLRLLLRLLVVLLRPRVSRGVVVVVFALLPRVLIRRVLRGLSASESPLSCFTALRGAFLLLLRVLRGLGVASFMCALPLRVLARREVLGCSTSSTSDAPLSLLPSDFFLLVLRVARGVVLLPLLPRVLALRELVGCSESDPPFS